MIYFTKKIHIGRNSPSVNVELQLINVLVDLRFTKGVFGHKLVGTVHIHVRSDAHSLTDHVNGVNSQVGLDQTSKISKQSQKFKFE